MKHLIIGNGVAGTTAAQQIRAADPGCEITVLTDEANPFYSRIRLIDFLAGEADEEAITLRSPGWYEEHSIALLLKHPASSLDLHGRRVLCGAEAHGFDCLLLATGGSSFVPPIPGAELGGVFTLRTLDDARAIRDYADGVHDVVLIGGGVLGLEAGNALRKRGKNVCVVEFFPRLLPRQMDEEGSGMLCSTMEDMGFKFFLGVKTRGISGDGRASSVVLDDGTELKAGMVVVSAGMRANASFAGTAGIECGKLGIAVDDGMRTSAPGVFAAGDCAEHRGRNYGLWPAAEAQGRVAGANMAGGDASFEGITPSSVLKVAGIELASAGDIDVEGKCECVIKQDPKRHLYVKLVHTGGKLRGCIVLGTGKNRAKILNAVAGGLDVDSLSGAIEEI